jgi:hypothetical protein
MTFKPALSLAVILLCGLTAAKARADNTSQILDEITGSADRLCGYVAQSSHADSTQATGQITAELNGLAKRLANLGVNGTGSFNSTDTEGIVQSELKEALNDLRACKLHVFDSLRKLVPDAVTSNTMGPIYGNQGIITQGQTGNNTILQTPPARHINDQAKQKLSQFLANKPKGQLRIKASITANDARAYANEIAEFLQDSCGWNVQVDNAIITGSDVSGIWLTIKDRDFIPDAASTIFGAFKYAEIPIRPITNVDPGVPTQTEVWLSIGSQQ